MLILEVAGGKSEKFTCNKITSQGRELFTLSRNARTCISIGKNCKLLEKLGLLYLFSI